MSQTLIVMLSMHIKCINIHTCIFCLVKIHHYLFIYSVCLLDYEPATLTVHPPPPRTAEGGFIFFVYVSSVPKKISSKDIVNISELFRQKHTKTCFFSTFTQTIINSTYCVIHHSKGLIAENIMHYNLKLECPEIMLIIAIIGLFLTVFPDIL